MSVTSLERWLPIPGYEGLYEVSDAGVVRSLERYVRSGKSGLRLVRERILKTHKRPLGGYVYVILCRAGEPERHQLIHRAVLSAFDGPCPDGYEGCHRDGNVENNSRPNLYWGTHSQNILDAVRHGTHPGLARNRARRAVSA